MILILVRWSSPLQGGHIGRLYIYISPLYTINPLQPCRSLANLPQLRGYQPQSTESMIVPSLLYASCPRKRCLSQSAARKGQRAGGADSAQVIPDEDPNGLKLVLALIIVSGGFTGIFFSSS